MVERRRRREAEEAFRETIWTALSCITSDGLFVSDALSPGSRVLAFVSGRIRLAVEDRSHLFFRMEYQYAVDGLSSGNPRIRTDLYIYTIYDQSGQRILGYHYHPFGASEDGVTEPHLHVYADVSIGNQYLPKLHLLTGWVRITDVVQLLIEGFRVRPRPAHAADWRMMLDRAREGLAPEPG